MKLIETIKDTLDNLGLVPNNMWDQILPECRKRKISPSKYLLEQGLLLDPMTGEKLSDQWNIFLKELSEEDVDISVKGRIPVEFVKNWKILPLAMQADKLMVAFSDPIDVVGIDIIEDEVGMRIIPEFVTRDSIVPVIERLYPNKDTLLLKEKVVIENRNSNNDMELSPDVQDAPIIALIEEIIWDARRQGASDIHIEPFAQWIRIRYRIDGILQEVDRIAKDLHSSIVTRIKIMANMDIAEKRLPQDGRILFQKNGLDLDLRVSTLNSNYGETVVIRLLDKQKGLISLEDLGMEEDMLAEFRRLINLPYGMILVTGPTGSGKSTTLYAALSEIDHNLRKVITVEDPVEYQLVGINQVQVKPSVGLSFASALRAILRQAPDVILVGEIRDKETAQIAVQASLTGHLVLSTLHTNDASSAVTRLIDMGVPGYLVASCIAGVLAQRLVRRLCENCKQKAEPSVEEKGFLKSQSLGQLYKPVGCDRCKMSGFSGRIGVFELISVNSQLRDSIARGDPADELRFIAEKNGMRSLREDGLLKVSKGITTVSEIMRVVR